VRVVWCAIYTCSAGGMQALMEDVRGAWPACMLLWLLPNIFAGGALLATYKFHAKLLSLQSHLSVFFLIALARQCVYLGLKR
jgi:hypothetical protein